jgi:hypothetical protein
MFGFSRKALEGRRLRVNRFEPPHDPLSWPRRLMGVFRTIVHPFVLAMLHAGHDLFLGRCITGQFVRDDHLWQIVASFEQLTEEFFCRFVISSGPNQDIEHVAMLITRSPQRVLLSVDFQKHLISMPCVSWFGTTFFQFIGVALAEFQTPLSDRFIGQYFSTFSHDLCDITEA